MSVLSAIEVLNRIHAADPSVLSALVGYRVPCNRAVADDPTVQVGITRSDGEVGDEGYEVGLLGILNGMFGVDSKRQGFIAARYDGDDLLGFEFNEGAVP